jgi:hypothetical protein
MAERNDTPAEKADSQSSGENAGLSPFYGTAKDVVARYSHCALCGANLHFTHVTDFSRNLTQETARCPECGVKARQAMHRLQ